MAGWALHHLIYQTMKSMLKHFFGELLISWSK
ncbi:hypothetical protein [Coxiella endosymbiont of Ornithodoros maritimus]|nr:hypothetical protein [Coxiella endosymbiont of Ornithodoros maritimus]